MATSNETILQERWANNGRRVVVVEHNQERFVEIGGEVVKIVTMDKQPQTDKQRRAAFLREMERKVNASCGRLVSKRQQEEWWAVMARLSS